MDSENKTIIIAGASSGIGLELAKCLLNDHVIYSINRTPGSLSSNPNFRYLPYDFINDAELPDIQSKAKALVYCPGSINLKRFEQLTPDDVMKDFKINAMGAFSFVKKYLNNIRNTENASILFFSTVAVQNGLPYHSSIAMAKGAIEGLTRSLAAELAPGIRVNAIAPSLTDTPLAKALLNNEAKVEANKQRHPLKEIGSAREIALFAHHLLTQSTWTTGQIFGLNGGMGTIIK